MPLSPEFKRVTVQGGFLDFLGVPATGTVTFQPPENTPLNAEFAKPYVVPSPISATLDSAGNFSVSVLVSDDPRVVPKIVYTLTVKVTGLYQRYAVEIPAALAPGPVELKDLLPAGAIVPGTTTLTRAAADLLYAPLGSTGGGTVDPAVLASKADAAATTAALATKADAAATTAALAAKADNATMLSALAQRASVASVALKADGAATTAALATKADASALASKADVSALETKAEASALAAKADAASPVITGGMTVSGPTVAEIAAGQAVVEAGVAGDTSKRVRVDLDRINWGSGVSARDFGLQRMAAGIGQFIGAIRTLYVLNAAAGRVVDGKVEGESFSRVALDTDSVMFGPGTATRDLGLRRTGVGTGEIVGTVRHGVMAQVVKTTGFTLSLTDVGAMYLVSTAGVTPAGSTPTAALIPTDATVAFPVGTTFTIMQTGTNQLTVAVAAGVTLRTTGSTRTRAQWSVLQVDKIGPNEWVLSGDTI